MNRFAASSFQAIAQRRRPARGWEITMICALLWATGCASRQGLVFDRMDPPLTWPAAPKAPRITYVGQLSTSDDLKRGQGWLEGLMEGTFGKKDAHGVLTPFALCTNDADRLFVADTGAQVVHVFDLASRHYAQWKPAAPAAFTQPVGVAWDPGGRLIVSDALAGRLFSFNIAGTYQGEMAAGILKKPGGLAIDRATRRIFVADVGRHQVLVLSPLGELIATIGSRGAEPGQFNYPTHVALDSRGYLYVADSLNFRIQIFNTELKLVRELGQPGDRPGYLGRPKGIALDSDGHLYIVDAQQDLVQIFDDERRLLLYFGGEGGAPGQFWLPAGIHIDSHDRIWIADTYNKRIAVFDYLREKRP